MVEAKGPGYARMLAKNYPSMVAGIGARFLRQGTKQVQAAGVRAKIWYFDESTTADFARTLFAGSATLSTIDVVNMPMNPGVSSGKMNKFKIISFVS
jgi:hypothetical protein